MERICKMHKTQLERYADTEGESLEQQLRRLNANNEPIPGNVEKIYTPKGEGVIPDYDIRTDRFDIAMQATDKFTASQRAKAANEMKTETPEPAA